MSRLKGVFFMTDTKIVVDYITTDEVADILGVSNETVKKWRTRKVFGVPYFSPDVKKGGTWLYDRERVLQLKEVYKKGTLQAAYKSSLHNFSDNFQITGTNHCIENFEELPTDLFTSEEVSKIFGISVSTLSRWNDSKKFVPFIEDHDGGFHYSREQLTQLAELRDSSKPKKTFPAGQPARDFFAQPENRIVNRINVQVYPSKIRIVPNCKLAKTINNLSTDNFSDLVVNGHERKIREVKKHKKFGDVFSTYKLVLNAEECDDSDPLNEFDRAVLSVCISEWEVGNRYTTPAIIYRALTGKVNKNTDAMPSKDQYAAIIRSVKKLISITLDTDLSDVNEKLNYNDGKSQQIFSPLLPACLVSNYINGQLVDEVIYFDRESPIMQISRDRKQLLTFDATLLDVPKQQNTPMNITAKNYVLNRILEIKLHKMMPVITFADIFQKCRIENASAKTKMDARNAMIAFMNHLKTKGEIRDFELTKKAQSFHSIKFSYRSKAALRKPKIVIENDNASAASKPLANASL